MKKFYLLTLSLLGFQLHAQTPTIGLVEYNLSNRDGYVLFAPNAANDVYMVDKCGYQVNRWTGNLKPGLATYFLPDGRLLKANNANNQSFGGGGKGGRIQLRAWDNTMLWNYLFSTDSILQHHDVKMMPNGNILMLSWQRRPGAEALANGKNPALLPGEVYNERIVEIQPTGLTTGTIVWEWNLYDHLVQDFDSTKLNYGVVGDHPELADFNYEASALTQPQIDWAHFNSIDYNEDLDQILISVLNFNEIWIIDHSTSTAEAAGHTGGNSGKGGDLLFRWGNPASYQRGPVSDQRFFGQHNASWIPAGIPDAGKLLIFNNGQDRPQGDYSSLEKLEVAPDANGNYSLNPNGTFLPDTAYWIYTAPNPTDFFARLISGVQPLADGSYMTCNGPAGELIELGPTQDVVWRYLNPVGPTGPLTQGANPPVINGVFRSYLYEPGYTGFDGITLTPTTPIELSPISPDLCTIVSNSEIVVDNYTTQVSPNPTHEWITVTLPEFCSTLTLYNATGQVLTQLNLSNQLVADLNLSGYPAGVYFLQADHQKPVLIYKNQ